MKGRIEVLSGLSKMTLDVIGLAGVCGSTLPRISLLKRAQDSTIASTPSAVAQVSSTMHSPPSSALA